MLKSRNVCISGLRKIISLDSKIISRPMFNIGGNAIEFVRQWPHLGNLINDICDDKDDILKKRNTMCGQINNVLCFFW